MNEQHLSNILFSLGTMGFSWSYLPKYLKAPLIEGIYRANYLKAEGYNLQQKFDFNNAGSKKGKLMNNKTRKLWSPRSPILAVVANGKEVNSDMSVVFEADLIESENENGQTMSAQGLSMSLIGLSKLGATWDKLPTNFLTILGESLSTHGEHMSPKQLSNTLLGLDKLNWRWEKFSGAVRDRLMSAVIDIIFKSDDYHSISMTVKSLGSMGVSWPVLRQNQPMMEVPVSTTNWPA